MESEISDIMQNGIPETWNDARLMQSLHTLEQKGFTKKVTWKQSTKVPDGIGIFADEPIKKGEAWRVYRNKVNLIIFKDESDVPPLTPSTVEYISHYIYQNDGALGIRIPGNSMNHSNEANSMTKRISEEGFHVIATKDIERGDELLTNYAAWGSPPEWFLQFAKRNGIWERLPFKGYNEFV